jgi:hypothetical protein
MPIGFSCTYVIFAIPAKKINNEVVKKVHKSWDLPQASLCRSYPHAVDI